ncbi:Stress response protein nst1 [Xylographa bjoerkii]|nr:Stress response protein nst1 [Xylographa bjoerkii]
MAPSSQRATPPAPQNQILNGTSVQTLAGGETGDVAVNRKKQKRRQKQAARLAAEQPSKAGAQPSNNGHVHSPYVGHQYSDSQPRAPVNGIGYGPSDMEDTYDPRDGDDLYYTDEDGRFVENATMSGSNGKSKRKKKTKSGSEIHHDYQNAYLPHTMSPSTTSSFNPPPPPPPPPLSTNAVQSAHRVSKDRIWNTSTQEERERIKEFWLSLEEKDRRSLVKVEKEAVLKKMKEQQKHSCSCTVCGRKRTAIEEELEVLYDAYYEELEQYANHQQISLDDGTPIIQPPRMYNHPLASPLGRIPPNRIPPLSAASRPRAGRIQELIEDDDDGDDEDYSDEDEEDEEYSEDDLEEEPRGPAADFFNFGNSLTVQGGILTVADDLLKNDGKKFIEMMEQLAERRMQREEEAQLVAAGLRHPSMHGHSHGPPLEDDEYDDEDDEEYDSAEDEEYDEDEMETMTEEQRMEEGRRMFQIFAARMFEQRVLTAYREKVARERQERLLEELADESRLDAQREAKRAKEAQKKKDKKRQQKQAKDEERAKREADKAAEEAALKAIEEQRLEEQRLKKEEQRRKREAEKKAQDEERQKREADKLKKVQDAREQQAETERKQREQKEREKKKREESKRKEREDREGKEREAKERKDREVTERREREMRAKVDKESKERTKKEEPSTKQPSQIIPIAIPPIIRNKTNTVVPLPLGLQTASSNHPSPHLQIATPVIPKVPTPVRPRQASFQDSHQSSPKSAHIPSGSSATSPTSLIPQQINQGTASKTPHAVPSPQQPLMSSSVQSIAPPPGIHSHPYPGIPMPSPMIGAGYPMSYAPMMPGIMPRAPPGHESPSFPHQHTFNAPQYRNFAAPNGLPFPPGINGVRPIQPVRGAPMDPPSQAPIGSSAIGSPAIGPQYGMTHSTMPSHSRHASASFEKTSFDASTQQQTQPIARPAPIKRPSSTPQQHAEDDQRATKADIDDLSNHLGSSALLDDTDDPLNSNIDDRRGSMAHGGPRSGRLGFGASPMFPDPIGSAAKMENFPRGIQSANTWGAPPMPFGTPSMSNPGSWSNAPGSGWSSNNAFGIIGGPNRHVSRPVTIRLLACQACKQLTLSTPIKNNNGFHSIELILRQVEQLKPANEGPIQLRELLQICDTEGNPQNGGGSFIIQDEPPRGIFVKYEPDNNGSVGNRGVGGPGEIGSPMVGMNTPSFGGSRGFQPSSGSIASPSGF